MTLLTSCWFIIESIIIPDGYVKWFYLSFYIHPLLLFLCQIFLWVKLIVSLPLRITCLVASSIFRFFSSLLSSFPIITQANVREFVDEVEENEIPIVTSHYQITAHAEKTGCENGSSLLVLEKAISLEDGSLLEYYLSSDCSSNSSPYQTQLDHHHVDMAICSSSSIVTEDVEMNGYLPSVCENGSSLLVLEEVFSLEDGSLEEYHLSSDCSSNSSPSQTQLDHHHLDMATCSSSSIVTEDVEMNGYFPCVCENGSSLLVPEEVLSLEDGSLEEHHLSSDCSSNSSPSQTQLDHHPVDMAICSSSSVVSENVEMNGNLPSVCGSNSPLMERELIEYQSSWEEDLDSFYQEYTKRMRWFDLLNHDRTSGISAMLDKHLASPCSFESIKPVEFSIPYISCSKTGRRELLRSLAGDFELVYVAQSCLSWEALYYQYRKVEALASSNSSQNNAFYDEDVAGRFQKFRVLLERFMEDERCEGKRYWNYVQRRFSSKCLLQVPQVSSGYMEGEGMRATEVLKEIEKCIEAFWLYVKTDNEEKPMWRRVKSFLRTNYYPPVEDPRDLELLAGLTNTLQKELWLRGLQGKKKCWLKRVINPLEESQKKEILFATIDMTLVSRVLKMSMISTSQLRWCQEKLTNIEFKEGKITRGACSSSMFIS